MKAAKIETEGDIIFCGNVGEEGLGDQKGVKHLLVQRKEIKAFVDRQRRFSTTESSGKYKLVATVSFGFVHSLIS
jgi:hypothetical protein